MKNSHLRLNLFRGRFAAEDGIFHGVIIPSSIAAGGEDVERLEIIHQVVKVGLTVFVKHNVREFDVDALPRQNTIAFTQDAALSQIVN